MGAWRDRVNDPEGNGYVPGRHEGEASSERYTRQIRNVLVFLAVVLAIIIVAGFMLAYHWGAA